MNSHSGKVLVVAGPYSPYLQQFTEEVNLLGLHFSPVDIDSIFHKVLQKTTSQYFENETKLIQDCTGKNFLHYLHMLSFAQKCSSKRVQRIYPNFYTKVQALNQIILYKFYEELCLTVQYAIWKGQNCIITHNFYYSPYPHRSEIFHQFFNMFGKNFKTLSIYTPLLQAVESLKNNNSLFRDYLSKCINGDVAYKDLQPGGLYRNIIPEPYLPFILLSEYTSYYKFSRKHLSSLTLETVPYPEMSEIFDLACTDSKQLYGRIIEHSYPLFYPRLSRMEKPKKETWFSSPPKKTYLSLCPRSKSDFYIVLPKLHDSSNSSLIQYCPEVLKWLEDPPSSAFSFQNINAPRTKKINPSISSKLKSVLNSIFSAKKPKKSPPKKFISDLLDESKAKYKIETNSTVIQYEISSPWEKNVQLTYKTNQMLSKPENDRHSELVFDLYTQISTMLNKHIFIKFSKK